MSVATQFESFLAKWKRHVLGAWRVPPPLKPSQHAELYRQLHNSSVPGPYRLDNAPYQRGLMDIPTRPGCVQAVCQKGARIGWSEVLRNLIGYWAHYEPKPIGLTLPSRDQGRKVVKADIMPMFRQTKALRDLIGSLSRDALIESIELLNGFRLGLMWSGSAAATAGWLYAAVIVDELDKTEDWAGDEPDLIGRLESRISTYNDRRLLLAGSTPTTTGGKIHQLLNQTSFILYYYVPCPHCGRYQRLVWTQFKWAKPDDLDRWLTAAREAAAGGALAYDDRGHVERFADAEHLAGRIEWLEDVATRMAQAKTKGQMSDVLAFGREHLVWYQCAHCPGRIFDQQKTAVIRKGRWSTERGYVVDYWGHRHEDAEAVDRWPNETRIGFQIPTWYSLFLHWGTIVGEFLQAEGDLHRAFNWRTERAGEPFEFRITRAEPAAFADKVRRATLDAGIVPAWGQVLLCTIDTQIDHFYYVVRAWGHGERSQRVWHGRLRTFDQLDTLLYTQTWPTEGGTLAPRRIDQAFIDSGGTEDSWIDITRTQQVYTYVIPRQATIKAIKGASRPGPSLYWRMKSPMGSAAQKLPLAELHAWLVDKHACNDLLADMIAHGVAGKDTPAGEEKWLLNRCSDPSLAEEFATYNTHMAAVHKAPDKPGRHMVEVWKPIHSGARVDYRDCEAYQIALARMCYVHLLPPEEEYLQAVQGSPSAGGDDVDYVERFRRH